MSWVADLWDAICALFSPAPVDSTSEACPECGPDEDPDAKLRKEIVEGMRLANLRINYGTATDPYHLDSKYWSQSRPGAFSWKLQPGAKPSEAVERIFQYDSGSRMECNSVMSAIHYRAMLKTVGPEKFDRMFENGMEVSARRSGHPFLKTKSPSDGLKTGDWVYVKGHPDYHSPSMNAVLGPGWGDWQGENAIVEPDGTYSGLGLTNETEGGMTKKLLGGYNGKVNAYNAQRPAGTPMKPYGRVEDMPGLANKVFEPDTQAIMKAANR